MDFASPIEGSRYRVGGFDSRHIVIEMQVNYFGVRALGEVLHDCLRDASLARIGACRWDASQREQVLVPPVLVLVKQHGRV